MSRGESDRTVRIIGGNWRGRKVSFAAHDDIRPTPARIRETLFNWLQYYIHGARCLELYAGSGVLSMEALSRGASHVTLVESSPRVMDHIEQVMADLCPDSTAYSCYRTTARDYLKNSLERGFENSLESLRDGGLASRDEPGRKDAYDIVFLDPPFASDELDTVTSLLADSGLLMANAQIYIESGNSLEASRLPDNWTILRQKRAGDVHYCLAARSSAA